MEGTRLILPEGHLRRATVQRQQRKLSDLFPAVERTKNLQAETVYLWGGVDTLCVLRGVRIGLRTDLHCYASLDSSIIYHIREVI